MGDETGIKAEIILPTGDWTSYLPTKEKQNIGFETSSCVTFSLLNIIETQFNFFRQEKLIPDDVIQQLRELDYFDENDNLNFSDRFIAVLSNTTKNGNDCITVLETIRKYGLLPEKDLPFGGTSFETYHDKSVITPAMKAKAKMILGLFNFNYDWVFFSYGAVNQENIKQIEKGLKKSPLQCGIPYPAHHAVMFYQLDPDGGRKYFDTYSPFEKRQGRSDGVNFGLRVVVTIKDRTFPIYSFKNDLSLGAGRYSPNEDVKMLQKCLKLLGLLNTEATGYFGALTKQAVVDFQLSFRIKPALGYFGSLTRAKMNEILVYDNKHGYVEDTIWSSIITSITNLINL